MKYTLRESMILGDVTYLIKTLSYTYQCVLESTQNMGATEVSGMAGELIDNQINECCRWIEKHDKHVKECHAEEISKYQKALAEAIKMNQPEQDQEDQKEM